MAGLATLVGFNVRRGLRDEVLRRQVGGHHAPDGAAGAAIDPVGEASDLNLASAGAVPLCDGGSGHRQAGEESDDLAEWDFEANESTRSFRGEPACAWDDWEEYEAIGEKIRL